MPRRHGHTPSPEVPTSKEGPTTSAKSAGKRDLWRPIAVLYLLGGLAIGEALGFWRASHGAAVSPTTAASALATSPLLTNDAARRKVAGSAHTSTDRVGPWGALSVDEIPIKPPMSSIAPADCFVKLPDWHFRDATAAGLGALLDDLGFEATVRDLLVSHAQCYVEGCAVSPSTELVARLSPATRARLHRELAREPRNAQLSLAFRCPTENLSDVLATSALSAQLQQRFRSLTYELDGRTWLLDIPTLCAHATTDAERVNIVRTLASTRGTLVRVSVPAAADVADMASYWSAGGRGRDSSALLSALAVHVDEVDHGASDERLDIAHLLPALPRARLDSYPRPNDPRYECTWTSLNFFVDPPTVPIQEPRAALQWLVDHANELSPPAGALTVDGPVDLARAGHGLKLGDALVFCDAGGNPIHLAAQVASDIVFTKNGFGIWSPWALQRLASVLATYPNVVTIRAFREAIPEAVAGSAGAQ